MGAGLALLALGAGCATRNETRSDPAYERMANETFAENDVRVQFKQRLMARFPEVARVQRDLERAQKAIRGPRFLGAAKFGYPAAPARPLTKLWVGMMVDSEGKVAYVECYPDPGQILVPAQVALVEAAVRAWTFTPMLGDGRPIAHLNVFPVKTDGADFYVPTEQELR